jgi:hypothetical protein
MPKYVAEKKDYFNPQKAIHNKRQAHSKLAKGSA